LSAAQLEIMDVLWRLGGGTVAEVRECLPPTRPLARNTVQTILTRLERGGWLRHVTEGNTHRYFPTTKRSTALGRIVSGLVRSAFRGSAEELVSALIDTRGLSEDEISRIRRLIDAAEGSSS
jgi:predicted transcriptional regulator